MKKWFCLVSLMILTSCLSRKSHQSRKIPTCPQSDKLVLMPRYYPIKDLYLGYYPDPLQLEFINKIIEYTNRYTAHIDINIIVPSTDLKMAYAYLSQLAHENKNIHFIPSESDEPLWVQDYFEMFLSTKDGKNIILDLPYFARTEENTPYEIALTKKLQLIEQAYYHEKEDVPGSGDYGGNIEALSDRIIIVGNNMTGKSKTHLSTITGQEILKINVEWLETGHVDELFSVFNDQKSAKACEQTLMVSSPKLALDLLHDKDLYSLEKMQFDIKRVELHQDGNIIWPDYRECMLIDGKKRERCEDFVKSNLIYQDYIDQSTEKIQLAFEKHHQCRLKTLKVPQLFIDNSIDGEFGGVDDRAVALNNNLVNNIFFDKLLILPHQNITLFEDYILKVLKPMKLQTTFVNSNLFHELSGGIHCATNASYQCEPVK